MMVRLKVWPLQSILTVTLVVRGRFGIGWAVYLSLVHIREWGRR